jgi:hypothetical protein
MLNALYAPRQLFSVSYGMGVVLSGPSDLTEHAVCFWSRQLPQGVSVELASWMSERAHELQLLWRDVSRMNRSRGMWQELTAVLEERDPTCAWTRNYDGLYFDSQLMAVTRTVHAGRRKRAVSLDLLLDSFATKPDLLVPLRRSDVYLPELERRAFPGQDKRQLKLVLSQLMAWRDKAVAHSQLGEVLPPLAWSRLDQAVTAVTDVFLQYSLRLTGVRYHVDFDGPQWKTWHSIFSRPLFP